MLTPAVTVILPVHNAGNELSAALIRVARALPSQSELLIIDDGSTDDSLERAVAFSADRTDVRVIAFAENSGVAAARNAALAVARGTYIWFVDWDDEWSDDIVRDMLESAQTEEADAVVTGARWGYSSGALLGRVEALPTTRIIDGARGVDAMLRGELKGYLWTKLFRREALPVDMFPPMRSQSDFCGFAGVVGSLQKIVILPDVRYTHVIREGSITNTKEPDLNNLILCREAIAQAARAVGMTGDRSRDLLRYDYAHWYLASVDTALRLSSEKTARSVLTDALSRMKWAEIARLPLTDARVAMHSTLVKLSGQHYPSIRRRLLDIRARLRNRRVVENSAR
ncbi:glycosyltransferase family 2 protein [Microbacterium sp. USHLN272]|uniref:glycosyltransferase family 2 protein n=1 Tax=Microbacterium sp. USHLN272 TaxID=3081287 RepID=UPI0030177780